MTTQNSLQAHLRPAGDIVAANVPDLRSQLKTLLASAGNDVIVLDLAQVHMVDSVGIGLLISVHNTLRKVGRQLALIHVAPDIFDLFRTLRMHQHFSISKD